MAHICERFDNLGADGQPAKLGLMGGTFDPIHNGHLRIAEEVREALGLDAVVFIPTGTPVFKRDQNVTAAAVRLRQVRKAVEDNPFFDVSSIEVDREGNTYTIDTLRQLRTHYPENVEFFFIVGDDAAASIGKWRACKEIADLCHLVVASGRPGAPAADELKSAILEAAPFDLIFADVSSLEISSSDIRNRVVQGKSARYLVPDSLLRSISAQVPPAHSGRPPEDEAHLAAKSKKDDPLSKSFFNARKKELEKRVSLKRFQHSLGVSDTCVKLAKEYGLDTKKARIAGLLHDWDKGYTDDQARARVRELGMEGEIDPYIVQNMPGVLHGKTAAKALAIEFPQIPSDVLQAIDRHTTAALDMSPLDMVLYVADAIEPNRQFGRIDDLRAVVGKVPLEELYFQTYEYWVFLLFERRKPLHPDTITIWNSYTERLPRKKKHGKGDGSVSRKGK